MKTIWMSVVCLFLATFFLNPQSVQADSFTDLSIHGFISQGYMKSTNGAQYMVEGTNDGTFEFNEMGLNISKDVSGNLRMGMQFFAHDLSNLGNDEVVLDWAFADYRLLNALGIRAGRMKIPYGLYNETRDIDMLRTHIFLPASVYGELFRDVFSRMEGVGIYGNLPGGLEYQVLGGTVKLDRYSGLVWGLNQDLFLEIYDVDLDYAMAGNLEWRTPLDGLRMGASLYRINDIQMEALTGDRWPSGMVGLPMYLNYNFMQSICGSIEYLIGDFVLAAEYVENTLNMEMGNLALNLKEKTKPVLQGYYGSIAYRPFSWMDAGFYHSEFYFDKHDRSGKKFESGPRGVFLGKEANDSWLKDTCLSVRFDLGASWCVKLEGHLMNGLFLTVREEGHENWQFYAAKVSYLF